MKKIIEIIKKEPMLVVSLLAAAVALIISPPTKATLEGIDFKTLAILFMLLSVLDGFKTENLFLPIIKLVGKIHSMLGLSFFLVFGVFFTSMFVTNDVSLIIFVPLTIIVFRAGDKERYILPIIVMENIAAVRGSLLTPFGSPQNLFLFEKSGMDAASFVYMMLPLWIFSIVLISIFLFFIYRKNCGERIDISLDSAGKRRDSDASFKEWAPDRRGRRILYLALFVIILITIVTRTSLWMYVLGLTVLALLIFDRRVFLRVDYVLLITFFCFFIFSTQITSIKGVADFLSTRVAGAEHTYSIIVSQFISNVPAAIVLWPFTSDLRALIYGLDTAGLVTIIGSLASVINLRVYTEEYPGRGKDFILCFEKICLVFFVIAFIFQVLIL